MTPRQKIELRRSEIRSRLGEVADLSGDSLTDEIKAERDGLMTELRESEDQLQASIQAEDAEARQRGDQAGGDGEGAELLALERRSSIGAIFQAAIEHRATAGADAELQEQLHLGPNQVPLALLRGPIEERAVTPGATNVGHNQAAIVPGVFPQSCAAFLGVDMPTVGVGEAVFPVLTQNAEVKVPAENAAAAETTGSFSADVLSPARLQASFFYSREDRARFAGMDESLRANLGDALADALDLQVINGANGLFNGANLANHAAGATVTDYTEYRAQLGYGRVDGTYAMTVADLRVVMGSASYAHAAGQFRSDNAGDRAALEDLMDVGIGIKVSSHVPAVAANKQNAVIRLGMRRDMVAPVWEGVTLIPDEITKAANGQIVITAVMLHAVKILRAGGFYKQETRHAV